MKQKALEGATLKIAQEVAARVGAIEGVVAVVLGGSLARGAADEHSDIDLGLYYHPSGPPSIAALNALAEEIDDRHPRAAATALGEWGPWINGGAWLQVEGQRVDWLYRDLERVADAITDCRAGRVSFSYQAGHPHAFSNSVYLGEIFHASVMIDPTNTIAALKAVVSTYPEAMRAEIIRHCLFEARFSLENAEKAARRRDVPYVAGCLYRTTACLTQVLFAHNRRYLVNEKGAVAQAGQLKLGPARFAATVSAILARPGDTPEKLAASVQRMGLLVAAVQTLCDGRAGN